MKSSMHKGFFFVFSFCFLLSIPDAKAQTGTASVHGTVLDKSHAAVAGARVTLVNTERGLQRDVVTPTTGEFEFLALSPGNYSLTVEKQGFGKYEQTSLQLLVNIPTTVNVTLEVGAELQGTLRGPPFA